MDFFTSFRPAIGVTKNEWKNSYYEALETHCTILNTQQTNKKCGRANEGMDQDAQPEGGMGGRKSINSRALSSVDVKIIIK